jgi:hypothetical protein
MTAEVTAMPHHLNPALSAEIREAVGHLPLWPGDPTGRAIDYTNAPVAYAVNITLIHGLRWDNAAGLHLPTPRTRALLVRRASGEGEIGSESGVSGFVDVLHHPNLIDAAFDPVAAAVRDELQTEGNLNPTKINAIDLHLGAVLRGVTFVNLMLGQQFEEQRFSGVGTIKVLPVLGVCHGRRPPRFRPNRTELTAANWVQLNLIARRPNLSPGYLENTLPSALGSLGLRHEHTHSLLYG